MTATLQAEEASLARWAQTLRRSPLIDMLALTARPGILSLALGLPAAELFPAHDFAAAAERLLATDSRALQYGPPLQTLKQHVIGLMAQRKVECREEQIFLTAGAQQGMNLLARLLLDHHGAVIIENLIYTGIQQVIEPYQPHVLTVPTNAETGMDLEAVESLLSGGARPAFIYAITDGHNPLGVSLSLSKRKRLVQLARQFRVPIVEDDAYGLLYYEDAPLPPLRAFDEQWVFYVGSFSKILGPALRAGWIVVPAALVEKLAEIKEAHDINTTTFSQRVINAYLDTGAIPSHLDMLRREYACRRDAMLRALAHHFPGEAQWSAPRSGFFVWVTLPGELNSSELLAKAVESEQVAFLPGHAFSAGSGDNGSNCIRLNFSHCSAERIEDGVKRLSHVLKGHLGD